jgi:6-phosphogluconolactonase (cycloisomerase 2 family)
VYVNHERNTLVSAYHYSKDSGLLTLIGHTETLQDPDSAKNAERVESSDIMITSDAKRLYVCIRGVNLVSVMDVDGHGGLRVKQNIGCCGDPRGLCMSPEGRYLYTCNMMAGNITTFAVEQDGILKYLNNDTKGVSPANMVFL